MEQVAAVCYRIEHGSIGYLLVRTHSGRWTFPKGNVEPGEERWSAAEREAFEEAGVTGVIMHRSLTAFIHAKKKLEEKGSEVKVHAFLLKVEKTQAPVERHRKPSWFSFPDAEAALAEDRPHKYAEELLRVLHKADNRIARLLK